MTKRTGARLEYHLKFNGRNPGHVSAALALASVDKQYKSSFIALAIGHSRRNGCHISIKAVSRRIEQPSACRLQAEGLLLQTIL